MFHGRLSLGHMAMLARILFFAIFLTLLPGSHPADAAGLSLPSSSVFSRDSFRSGPEARPIQLPADENTIPTVDLTNQPGDLWERIRNGFAMPDLVSDTVTAQQIWFLNRQDYIRRTFERSRRYLYYIVEQLEKRGMPTELALLPVVESAYNPMAYSPARASGIWQFIPSTGRNFGLKQDSWQDERRDIIASTNAALDYLQTLYEMQGDWHLALASYNWGEGAVMRAVNKNKAAGKPTDYLSLTMPNETRNYVPRLQAIKNIVANPALFGVRLDPIPNRPYFATIKEIEDMDLATAAKLAEVPLDEAKALNPSHTRQIVRTSAGASLVLPAEKVATFMANYENRDKSSDKPPILGDKPAESSDTASTANSAASIPVPESGLEGGLEKRTSRNASWKSYAVQEEETLESLADRFGVTPTQLRLMNGLGPRGQILPGQTLLVPSREAGSGLTLRPEQAAPAQRTPGGRYTLLANKKASGIFSRSQKKEPKFTYRIEKRLVKDKRGHKHLVLIKHKVKVQDDDDEDEDDDEPPAKAKGKNAKADAKSKAAKGKSRRADDDDDDDEPPAKAKGKNAKADAKGNKAKAAKGKSRAADDDDDDDDEPPAKAKGKNAKADAKAKAAKAKSRRAADDDDDDDDDDEPPVKAKGKNTKADAKVSKAKAAKAQSKSKSRRTADDDDDDDEPPKKSKGKAAKGKAKPDKKADKKGKAGKPDKRKHG